MLLVDIVAACLILAMYRWFSPATAVWYAVICLVGFGGEIVALVVRARELADRDRSRHGGVEPILHGPRNGPFVIVPSPAPIRGAGCARLRQLQAGE